MARNRNQEVAEQLEAELIHGGKAPQASDWQYMRQVAEACLGVDPNLSIRQLKQVYLGSPQGTFTYYVQMASYLTALESERYRPEAQAWMKENLSPKHVEILLVRFVYPPAM